MIKMVIVIKSYFSLNSTEIIYHKKNEHFDRVRDMDAVSIVLT